MNPPYLEEALELARRGTGLSSPNPAVGAMIVRDGIVVGRGFHTYGGVKHAEVLALEEAGDRARGATCYVSLEPCCHRGRTGSCTAALIEAGVAHVIAAMEDPNPLVRGEGMRLLRAAGIEAGIDNTYRDEAAQINEAFIHFMQTGRPLVMLKAALTLDGKIAAPEDNRGWITSEQARLHVQTLRHSYDAILTGIGTVLADDPLLNDRTGLPRSRPLLRIVLDSQLRISPQSRMVESCQSDVLIVTTTAASDERRRTLLDRGVQVLVLDGANGRTEISGIGAYLAERRYLSLMIEAGSKVNWAVLESGLVDKIFFYYAPKILGGVQSLPVAGGPGRQRRADALQFRNVRLHSITADEFAVEAWLIKE